MEIENHECIKDVAVDMGFDFKLTDKQTELLPYLLTEYTVGEIAKKIGQGVTEMSVNMLIQRIAIRLHGDGTTRNCGRTFIASEMVKRLLQKIDSGDF